LQAVTRLGRSAENSVVLEDQFVSAVHAIVLLRDGRWWVRDAGSTNGTVLNGSNVVDESPLRDGDELQVGGVRLRVST
jgi:pSer/pThr/pTyr-binding forkhead associated (FHA) protein